MFMQTTTGMLLFIVCPLLLLVGWDVLRRSVDAKREKERTRELEARLKELEAALAAGEWTNCGRGCPFSPSYIFMPIIQDFPPVNNYEKSVPFLAARSSVFILYLPIFICRIYSSATSMRPGGCSTP